MGLSPRGASEVSDSKSSPWTNSKAGGALVRSPVDLQEEPTVTEVPAVPRAIAGNLDREDANPSIAQVGFTGPRGRPGGKDPTKQGVVPRRALPDERSDTEQIPVDDLLKQVREMQAAHAEPRPAQPWDEVIEAASSTALSRHGTTRDAEARTVGKTEAYGDAQKPQKIPTADLPPFPRENARGEPAAAQTGELLANRPVNATLREKPTLERESTLVPPRAGPHPSETIAAPGELAGSIAGPDAAPRKLRTGLELVKDPLNPNFHDKSPSSAESAPPRSDTLQLHPAHKSEDPPLRARAEMKEKVAAIQPPADTPTPPLGPLGIVAPDTTAPVGEEASTEGAIKLSLATFGRRAAAIAIDTIVLGLVVGVPMVLGVFGKSVAAASLLDPDDMSALIMNGALLRPAAALVVLIFVGSAASHAFAGRTIGKLITGLELVTRKTGERPGPTRSILRALFQIGSILFMGSGYLWLLVDRRSRAIHDWLSGTIVVVAGSRRHAAPAGARPLEEPEPTP
jgi:uncharacterized RDD family membrane protein YckC